MPRVRPFLSALRALFQPTREEHELDTELHAFLEASIEEKVGTGMDRQTAERLAGRELGNVSAVKERVREVGWESTVEGCWRDVRYAVRGLRKAPGFAAITVLSLALGIGGTTGIFSILDSLLLKPLPVRNPGNLVVIGSGNEGAADLSYPVWKELHDSEVLPGAFAWASDRLALTGTSELAFVQALWATGDALTVLGVPATIGRTLTRADDRPGGGPDGPVAVVSHAFWQRRLAGSDNVLGWKLLIEGVPFTIVGVTPAGFSGPEVGASFDVMLPLDTEPLLGRVPPRLNSATWPWLHVMARATGSDTPRTLTARLVAAQPRIRERTMPPFDHEEDRAAYLQAPWTVVSAAGGVSTLRRRYEAALLVLFDIVASVLLVACASIATLMLARASARHGEFAVRRALGANRQRLVRQLLIESLLLSSAGSLLGVALARWGAARVVAQLSTWVADVSLDLSMDWRVLAVTMATTVATALLCGLVPAWRSAQASPLDALSGGRAVTGNIAGRLTATLTVVQVAFSLVLIVGAALFLRSFVSLAYRDLGFDRSRLLVAVVDVNRSVVPPVQRLDLYERVRAAAAAVPGVESAALSLATPLGSAGVRLTPDFSVPGGAEGNHGPVRILTVPVSPGWFRTFGTRLLAGRDFNPRDRRGSREVAIVNEAFARRYFDRGSALGERLVEQNSPAAQRSIEIVGLVENAAFTTVRDAVEPTVYRPLTQQVSEGLLAAFPSISVSVRARSALAPATLSHPVAAAIGAVDPGVTVFNQTVTLQMRHLYTRERLLASVSALFGSLGLLLAATGLYGVTAYSVRLRGREIAIRMAIGATTRSILRMVLTRLTWCIAAGIGLGGVISFWAAGLARALLFDIGPHDAVAFASAAGLLAAIAGLAAWLPARYASRVQPASVLRQG